jgi:hypothetical protein
MLSLSKIQQWHYSRFLILWRVSLQDLLNELIILLSEREGCVRIIVGGIAMLDQVVRAVQPAEESLRMVNDTHNVECIAG